MYEFTEYRTPNSSMHLRIEHKDDLNFKQVGLEEVTIKLYFLLISMFHRAFFNSMIDKHQRMHFTFNNILVYNSDFNVKIHKSTTLICFDLNRSSSGSRSVPR